MEQANLVRIAVSGVPYAADKLFTYRLPDTLSGSVVPGVRVTVPFGNGNRRREGVVLESWRGETAPRLKPVETVLDAAPLLDAGELQLIRWMKARFFCTYYDAIKAVLPAGVWFRYRELYRFPDELDAETAALSAREGVEELLVREIAAQGPRNAEQLKKIGGEETAKALHTLVSKGLLTVEKTPVRSVSDKTLRMVSLAEGPEEALAALDQRRSSPVRRAVVELLCSQGTLATADLSYYTGAAMSTLRRMEKDGLLRFTEREVFRVPAPAPVSAGPIVLNEEQQAAFEGLNALAAADIAGAALLHGVTASGKTQVYIRLIEETLARGKTALLLVPEIALTPQMMAKFSAYFGDEVAMLHSALRLTERYDQWKRIRRGDVKVVLGTRSAVFAPLPSLGLIIMDEEQEGTYQSENPPRYHARDVAQYRCAQNDALLVLGSATPTVETSFYARSGRYRCFSLKKRYNEQALPAVEIADMREELRSGNDGALGALLRSAIGENLRRGEQSILFLNRRGSSRMLICPACGHVPECPRCSAPLTYHSANRRLMCHYCGFSEPAYERCPDCGGKMKHLGMGTQKVEQELTDLFPGVGVLRMDADTVGGTHTHEELLSRFVQEKTPILLGTQMVAKGLDFENVTLVGVLAADLSLYVDSYRAAERTFSLLSQVVGRAGRGSKLGRAIIQTFTPRNDVILAAAAQDYEAFYQSEIRMRRLRRYPPFADLFTLTVTGQDEGRVLRASAALRDALRAAAAQGALRDLDAEVLGPAPAPVLKVNNRYRYRIYLVAQSCAVLRRVIAEYLLAFHRHKENRGLELYADCNAT